MNTANPFHFKGIENVPKIFFNQIKDITLFRKAAKEKISNTSFPDGVGKQPHQVFKDLGIDYVENE